MASFSFAKKIRMITLSCKISETGAMLLVEIRQQGNEETLIHFKNVKLLVIPLGLRENVFSD